MYLNNPIILLNRLGYGINLIISCSLTKMNHLHFVKKLIMCLHSCKMLSNSACCITIKTKSILMFEFILLLRIALKFANAYSYNKTCFSPVMDRP